ncbi:GNAT family N-acetyltransferase [Robertmurraya andreesenii]|uniref:Acetyltransferase n=1 Tax=Anoxybacillus andreesenii TaxID=1325932 RepID=A0ABT9V1Q5_9BACL|nr:GNAT family N-acetyltransferase [Robertmurraya andreesenii]MDQ0154800.1 putative acetyltransferase [Robertmurraya andreesenii]
MINLIKIPKEDEYILHNLMQFYIYEFSQCIPSIKLEENGSFAPFQLEKYWNDPNFHPFFIKSEEEFVGFALVECDFNEGPHSINEFFIMSKFKGRGFGKEAATKIFRMFPGKWMITQIEKNYPAQAFWRSLIYRITNGNMAERYDEHRRSIQEFHTDFLVDN